MTFRQMYAGAAIGVSMSLLSVAGVLPEWATPAGLLVVLFGIIAGGVDGTLPQKMT
jgi:hypothetical protein